MSVPTTFLRKAPKIMSDLMADFDLSSMHAAAIIGNGGHESGGFTKLQELKPTVQGSRGGFGWFQWTGPRRRAFEAWCKKLSMDPVSDAANYGFLKHELSGEYASVIAATKRKQDLRGAVVAFELGFERAGVKHYDSRLKYAQAALTAWQKINERDAPPAQPDIPPPPDDPGVPEQLEPRQKTWRTEKGLIGSLVPGADAISSATDVVRQVNETKDAAKELGLLDYLSALLTNPRFVIPLVIFVAIVGGVIWWQFRKRR